ncbi:hypothetical protein TrRE_jg7829, partial [Triparma retinervis]
WKSYCLIPIIAALVGYITNYLAVQMIFYPVNYIGLPLWVKDGVPLGLFGWRGIVPSKTKKMTEAMVTMVTEQLLDVQEVFLRLKPEVVAEKVKDVVPAVCKEKMNVPYPITKSFGWFYRPLLTLFVKDIQHNVDKVFDVRKCVVDQMMQDRGKLGTLFQECGRAELKFLTNSGLWFGFLLGLIQMLVALFVSNPWSLSFGGLIVGLATNWLALKWIFTPVNPTKILGFGPFQGLFLTRQKEVSETFSKFFAENVLTSERIWESVLGGSRTRENFVSLMTRRVGSRSFSESLTEELPNHLHKLHPYVDSTLKLRPTLETIKLFELDF